jgi:thiol:disulfide interchange protein
VPDEARLSAKSVVVLQNLCHKVSIIMPCMLPVYTMIVGLLANKNIGSMCLVLATSVVLIFYNNGLHVGFIFSIV